MYDNPRAPTTANVTIDGSDTIPMSFTKKVGKLDEYQAHHHADARPADLHVPVRQRHKHVAVAAEQRAVQRAAGAAVRHHRVQGDPGHRGAAAWPAGHVQLHLQVARGQDPGHRGDRHRQQPAHDERGVAAPPARESTTSTRRPISAQGTRTTSTLQFDDGSGLQSIQEYSVAITPIYLQDSSVSPTSGTTSTNYTFSTTYTGPDAATEVDVVVDGTSHPMTLQSGNPTTGAVYQATLSLPAGGHKFAFYATDGTNAWSDPLTPGTYSGLTVSTKGQAVVQTKITAPQPDTAPYAFDQS